jgi:DNA-binding transcriptional LysR family regulator
MAQPPLSRAVRDLERQLGVTLLERTTRQVRLTAAGEVLLRDARTALEAVTAAARRAREAGSPSPRLRVALKADVDGGLLPQILDAYCASVARRYPRPEITYLPVSDLPDSTLALAWPQDARSPAVAAFVRAACTIAAAAHPQAEPAMQSAAT